MDLRVGIIGSGASGLFCGAFLADSNVPVSVTIFEQGPEAHLRCQGVESGTACNKCKICSVSNGLGGNALVRGMRLSTHPAGSGLVGLINSRYDKCESLALESWANAAGLNQSLALRGYGAFTVDEVQSRSLLEFLKQKVVQVGSIRCEETVQCLMPSSGGWIVGTENEEFQFDKVVVAGGKGGLSSLYDSLNQIGVAFAPNHFEYGCRIEFPSYPSSRITSLATDHKLKVALGNNISARTYCWSHPGKSILIRNFGMMCLDGAHENASPSTLSFAVLVKIQSLGPTSKSYLQMALENQNRIFGGKATVQKLSGFLNKTFEAETHGQKHYDQFQSGNLEEIFGDELTNLLRSAINSLGIPDWPGAEEAFLLGPCIEKTDPIPILKTNHESTMDNLFFIGDCSGLYRGALQASIAGIDVARGFVLK